MKRFLCLYVSTVWMPGLMFLVMLGGFAGISLARWSALTGLANGLFFAAAAAFNGMVCMILWHLIRRRWLLAFLHFLLMLVCAGVTAVVFAYLFVALMFFGPSEDGFADDLVIPDGIEISDPETETRPRFSLESGEGMDRFQKLIRNALAVPGGENPAFSPHIPSLRQASLETYELLMDYLDASPDWHMFYERGNRFAYRRWSYGGEPRGTLHGYISEFGTEGAGFQTRTLLCLDRQQWSRYRVQTVREGSSPITPRMSEGNRLHESRVMIDCGGVWVEIFEQSNSRERRITRASVQALEEEFSGFLNDPGGALAVARARARELAGLGDDYDRPSFRLLTGMQPGIYTGVYALNPGEPGSVYLRAYEVTQGTPLSVSRLRWRSETRMAWSDNPAERFEARAGFTIYEGDWGKPYAARFEVWFQPDSGQPERKLAARNFRIEGWQR